MSIILNKNHIILTSTNEMHTICEPIKKFFGATYFSYVELYPPNIRIQLCMSSVDWVEFYYKNFPKYFKKTEEDEDDESGLFTWDMVPSRKLVNADMRNYFNIANGVILVREKGDHCESFFFAGTSDNYRAQHLFVNNQDLLERFASYFKEKAAHLIKEAKKQPIIMPPPYPSLHLPNKMDSSSYSKDVFIEDTRVTSADQTTGINLSAREKECLHLYVRGKTAKEIGKALHLSNRTIENYLQNIKLKLGLSSKSQLIHKTWHYFK